MVWSSFSKASLNGSQQPSLSVWVGGGGLELCWNLKQLEVEQKTFWALNARTQHWTRLVSFVHYTDRRHHLEHDLISLILAVPQVEAITTSLYAFLSKFPTTDPLLCSKTTAPLWKDISSSPWSVPRRTTFPYKKKRLLLTFIRPHKKP